MLDLFMKKDLLRDRLTIVNICKQKCDSMFECVISLFIFFNQIIIMLFFVHIL